MDYQTTLKEEEKCIANTPTAIHEICYDTIIETGNDYEKKTFLSFSDYDFYKDK